MNDSPSSPLDASAELAGLRLAHSAERKRREGLELALRASGQDFWEWHPVTDRLFLSTAIGAALGLSFEGEGIPASDYFSRIHPDDADRIRNALVALLKAPPDSPAIEESFRIADIVGQWRWVSARAVAEHGPDGRVRRVAGTHADISGQKEAEAATRNLRDRFSLLYGAAPVALIMWNPKGHVVEWNRQAERLFGWSAAQVFGKRIAEQIVAVEDRPVYAEMARRAVAEGKVIEATTDCLNRDGQTIRCRWSSLPLKQDGALVGLMTLALDVTDQYRTECELEVHRNELERLVAQRTEELANTREALAQIIDNSPIPTFALDELHCVTHWNKACEKIFGIPAQVMIGTANQWQAFYPESRPCLADLVMFQDLVMIDALYSGKVAPSSLVPGAFDAEDYFPVLNRWLFFSATPIRDASGKVIGAIETLIDISARKQAEMALQEAKAEAEAAARVKADFLANMSHEIRTPLNAIIGFAHLLQKTELTPKQHDHVQRLRTSGDMLLQLINDILDFSKIEAGKMPIETEPFELDTVLDQLSGMIGQRTRDKGLELHFVVDTDVPSQLVGDSLRLTQVLVNLLSNAVKFTESGQILVFVSVAERSERNVRLEIAVQDTGIGLTTEQQGRLFRAFSQADTSTTRKYGGTGLGLTICQRLVELMGGTISVSSTPEIGSTFLFDVRLGIGHESSQHAPATGQRVLVVDDNAIARTVHARLLEKLGYLVEVADSGAAALAAVAEATAQPFRYVFLDWNMPGMNGVEVAQRLRTQASQSPEVIVITSAGQSEAEAAFTGASVSGLILKPVSATSLAAALNEIQSTPSRAPSPAPEARPPRLPNLRVLLVDDVETNRMIAGEILTSEGALVTEAENGQQAVEKVLNGGPWDVVLMDVQMPVMDGLEATRTIRADGRHGSLPILAMTAFARDDEMGRCRDAGMDGLLTKPIDPDKVVITLADIAARVDRPVLPQTSVSVPTSKKTTNGFPALPGIDTAEGLKRMINKPAFYEKMLRSFHDRFAHAPVTVREHLAAGRFDDARREAHSAKGVAASISANELRDAALALEKAIAGGEKTVEAEITRFATALDGVLTGLRQQFGWSAPPQ